MGIIKKLFGDYSSKEIKRLRPQLEKTLGLEEAYKALSDGLRDGENGLFCETAHPAKFKDTVEKATGQSVGIPDRLAAFMQGKKVSVPLPADFKAFKEYLM